MKQQFLAKLLIMVIGVSGISILIPIVSTAFAETSMPKTLQQSDPVTSTEIQSNNIIDISIDVNQDGVSDQLLEETQKVQAFQDAELERFRSIAESTDGPEDPALAVAYEAYSTAATAANIQLEARLPLSDNARSILAKIYQLVQQYEQHTAPYGEVSPEQSAIEAELRQFSEELDQDSSYVEVLEAQRKVFAFIDMS